MNEWGGKIFYSHGSQNSCGVAVLIRNGFNCTVKKTIIDPSGRFIVLKVDIEDKVYVLVKTRLRVNFSKICTIPCNLKI